MVFSCYMMLIALGQWWLSGIAAFWWYLLFIGFIITESFGKWVADDFQLGYLQLEIIKIVVT